MLPGDDPKARRRAPKEASRQQGVATLKVPAEAVSSAAAPLPAGAGAGAPPAPASIVAAGSPVAGWSEGAEGVESPAAVSPDALSHAAASPAGAEFSVAVVFAGGGLSPVEVSLVAVVKAAVECPAGELAAMGWQGPLHGMHRSVWDDEVYRMYLFVNNVSYTFAI